MFLRGPVLILGAVFLVLSCGGDTGTKPKSDGPLISENAIPVDAIEGLTLTAIDGTTYTFEYTGAGDVIAAGGVIVGSEMGGYLRMVESVDQNNSTLTVETSDAVLTDIIERGQIDTTVPFMFVASSSQSATSQHIEARRADVSVIDGVVDLSETVVFDGNVGGVDLNLIISEGSVAYEPDINVSLEIDQSAVQSFEIGLDGDLQMDLTYQLTASGPLAYSDTVSLVSFVQSFEQMIGDVPVVVNVTLTMIAGFNVSGGLDGMLTFGAEGTVGRSFSDMLAEQTWTSSGMSNDLAFTNASEDWSRTTPIHVSGFIIPRVQVSFYSQTVLVDDGQSGIGLDGQITPPASWTSSLSASSSEHHSIADAILGLDPSSYTPIPHDLVLIVEHDTGTVVDDVSPAAVVDLMSVATTPNSVTLTWTAPGDDGDEGTASVYDVRYATEFLTDNVFIGALQAEAEPVPQSAGTVESFVVSGLSANTQYYFALNVADEIPNWSGLSNVISATTGSLPGDLFEPDNTLASARPIMIDADRQEHTIDPAGDVDWIRIESEFFGDMDFEFRALNGLMLHAILYEEDGETVIFDRPSIPSGFVTQPYRNAPAAVYYLKITAENADAMGDYSIRVKMSDPTR